jgi:hypothetical protein
MLAEWGKRKKREKKEAKQGRERVWGGLVAVLITF